MSTKTHRWQVAGCAGWFVVVFLLLSGQANTQTAPIQLGTSEQSPIYIRLVGAGGSLDAPFYANVALPSHATSKYPLYINTAIVGEKSSALPVVAVVGGQIETDTVVSGAIRLLQIR